MLRLALVGCADGGGAHPRLAPRLHGGRFSAAVDRDAGLAKNTALALGAEVSSDSLDALLAEHSSAVDAVVLRIADQFLDALCRRAAAAGKHVLADGPLAATVADTRRLVAACAGVRLMVGPVARFLPSLRVVKERLDAGRLGEPGLLRVHRWEPPDPHAEASGETGHLLYRLTREIDVACWLFGQHPTGVYAASRPPHPHGPDGPGYVQLHLGFPRGGMALIDYARTLPPGDSYFSLSLIGSAGAAYADDHHNTQLLYGGGRPAGLLAGQGDAAALAQLQEFVDAVTQGREPSVTGADGLRAAQVMLAAARSVATGDAFHWGGEHYSLTASAATQVGS
jgi:myo-inositol 2-dehydrogenase/D-chiro-inositol 1-dehydrogenase